MKGGGGTNQPSPSFTLVLGVLSGPRKATSNSSGPKLNPDFRKPSLCQVLDDSRKRRDSVSGCACAGAPRPYVVFVYAANSPLRLAQCGTHRSAPPPSLSSFSCCCAPAVLRRQRLGFEISRLRFLGCRCLELSPVWSGYRGGRRRGSRRWWRDAGSRKPWKTTGGLWRRRRSHN